MEIRPSGHKLRLKSFFFDIGHSSPKIDRRTQGLRCQLQLPIFDPVAYIVPCCSQRVFFGQPADKLNKWVDAAVTFVNAHLLLHANNSLAIVGAGRDQVNSLGFFAKLSTP